MRTKKPGSVRVLSVILALLMIVGILPVSAFAAYSFSEIPEEMLDNVFLDALEYIGYDVQGQIDDQNIYQLYGSSATDYGSGIGYTLNNPATGTETVSDPSTATGLAPDLDTFRSREFCCASYTSYVYYNYLPNILGIEISSEYAKPTNLVLAASWDDAAKKWVSDGLTHSISFTQTDTTFSSSEEIPIGSLLTFWNEDEGRVSHVAIYAGAYDGKHFVTHIGNSRGPEITTIEGLTKSGSALKVNFIVPPPVTIEKYGRIEINKVGPNGETLAGARFMAVNQSTGDEYPIGPTNSKGYAMVDNIPLGKYKITETVAPTGYIKDDTVWTVTLDENTPNGTITINAVNKKAVGSIEIYKKDPDGKALAGAVFSVVNINTNESFLTSPTNSNGYTILKDIPFGDYSISETKYPNGYGPHEQRHWNVWLDEDTPNATVTIEAVNNPLALKILKVTSTGTDLAGWQFKLYTNSAIKTPYLNSSTANRYYRVKITDKYGNVVYSDPAHLSVGPHITQQPVNQSVAAGSTVKFTVAATGDGLTYQWQYSTNSGTTWTNSSGTSSSFSYTMSSAFNGRQYRCVVTDSSGNSVTSDAAAAYLPTTLAILTQPESVVSAVGAKATFKVTASGSGLSYQWQASSNGGTTWSNIGTLSTYSATKTKTPVIMLRCVVSDGSSSVTSDTVYWVRSDNTDANGNYGGIFIVDQPEDYVGKLNANASFNVLAAGKDLVYQWEYLVDGSSTWLSAETQPSGFTGTYVTGTDGSTRLIEKIPAGSYYVKEINDGKENWIYDSVPKLVEVTTENTTAAPAIVTFTNIAVGQILIRKKVELPSTAADPSSYLAGWKFQLYQNSPIKTPYLTDSTANRSYRVKITDKYGNVVYSDPAHLSIGPHITQQPVSQSVAAGTSTSISVKAEGTGLTYQWQYKYVGTSTWTNSSSTANGAYTDTFTFTMASSFNNRQYRCVITDSSGNVTYSEAATLYLPTTLAILTQPKSVVSNVGDKASFAVKASGSNLKYQWQASSNGGTSWNNIGTMSTYTGTKTATPALLLRCVISDGTNTVTTDTVQWVRSDYKNASGSSLGICIVEQPEDYVGNLNSTASFDVLAAGEGLVYQWEYLVDTDETQTWLSAETLYSSTEYETGADGTVLITDIPVGSYYVKEINDGKVGWVYDLVPKAVEVTLDHTTDAPAEVTFTNTLADGTITVNKVDEAGNPLAGAGFVAVGSNGARYEFSLTDSLGTATVSVPYDTYTITEIIFPEGFEAGDVTEWTVTVSSETPHKTITAENREKKGTITVNKVDENGNPLAGAGFVAVAEDGTRYEFPLTDTAGSASITVPFGSYTIYEVVFPEGYEAGDVTNWSVTIDDNTTNRTCSFTAVNKLITGSLTFRKATTTGNGVELGWTAKLWRIEENGDWTYIGSGTTKQDKDDPTYTWTDLIPGRYVLQEDPDVTHPGFAVDTEYHYIDVVGNDTAAVTITNTELGKGKVTKRMADGSSPADWAFDIYRVSDNSHVGTYVTGEDGTFTTDFLMPGDYLIVEKIPEDSIYECIGENPQTFTVVAGETASVTFTNALRPGKISIEKVNSEGEKLAGAKFLLEWSNDGGTTWAAVTYNDSSNVILGGCTTEGLADGCLTTDSTGIITFDGLHPGLMYRVTELEAPEGYLLLADYAFTGELPIEDLTVSLTVHNSRAYTYPASGSTEMTNLAAAGTFLAVLVALMSITVMLSSKPVFSVKNHVENKFKGENKQ